MFLGAVAGTIWSAASPRGAERNAVPLASGLIAGEAIVAVIIPVLVAIGLVHLR
jgi:uncharacterized oligopeptide transporter (OPT) family protein